MINQFIHRVWVVSLQQVRVNKHRGRQQLTDSLAGGFNSNTGSVSALVNKLTAASLFWGSLAAFPRATSTRKNDTESPNGFKNKDEIAQYNP